MSVIIAADRVREPLYAIVPLFDPWRWKSRWKHVTRAIKHFADSGVVVILVEAAFNRRDLVFADSGLDGMIAECGIHPVQYRHKYIGLRTKDELWLKENLINVGVQSLPYDWQQVCWLDSDIHFVRPNWAGETIHKLQHYDWLQMFSSARDVGPNYEELPNSYPHAWGISFIKAFQDDKLPSGGDGYYYLPGAPIRIWPGLAWACTRRAWDGAGGLIDFAIWGGADWHMSHALVGNPTGKMMRNDLHPNYKQMVDAWMSKVTHNQYSRRNCGIMEGTVFHYWHGRKEERGYNNKHSALAKIGFDPIAHLKRDYQGLYQLHDDGSDAFILLRETMRVIAQQRNEDVNEI